MNTPPTTPGTSDELPIAEVLTGLLGAMDNDALQSVSALPDSPELQRAKAALVQLDPDHFDLFWRGAFETRTRGLLLSHGINPHSRAGELMANSSFYREHLRALFSRFEGGACCADKARWALRQLFRHHHTGAPIVFSGAVNAFWEPKRILTSQDWLLEFFDALYRLRHGSPDQYLAAMLRLAQSTPAPQT